MLGRKIARHGLTIIATVLLGGFSRDRFGTARAGV